MIQGAQRVDASASADTRAQPLILHLIDELKIGGAQTHLVTMLREALAAYPVAHRVVALFGDGPVAGAVRDMGVEVDVLDLRPHLARRRFLGAARVLDRLICAHRPDVVEAHLTWSRLLGLYAAWRAGVPRRIGFEQGDVYLASWKFRLANRIGQHFADQIVVCSHALADWSRRTHGISPRRLTVLHNCVDLTRFRPGAGRSEAGAFGLPPGTTVFGAVGTLGRGVDKRTDVAIRAVAAARARGNNVALVICGDGDQRPELEALAAGLGVSPWIRFLGTRGDVPDVLAACDAFCHAAPFEPFGIVCIEAMAAGLPVLVPDSGGIREAVDDGVTGLVYPALDHEALARLMGRLHERPDLRRALGHAARRAAEGRFSARGYVAQLYELYNLARHTS
ncbi:MAG: glycosyltransferase family 4 protein [Isosphaeraceae bacterium]|nr:glycosyltransferase family 4 protein [Isosphaeraceae bacterium]